MRAQSVPPVACHSHPSCEVTPTRPSPPFTPKLRVRGSSEKVHTGAAAWLIVTTCCATVTVAERAAPVFGAADTESVAGPRPVAADPNVTHVALFVACQLHAEPIEIATECVLPPAAALIVAGATDALHVGAGSPPVPSWLTVTDWPPTEIEPSRGWPLFAVTSNSTVPDPLPEGDESRSQSVEVDAVHAQPDPVSTESVPRPPARAKREGCTWRSNVHGRGCWLIARR
jgi:hypothetical protein